MGQWESQVTEGVNLRAELGHEGGGAEREEGGMFVFVGQEKFKCVCS